MDTSNVRHLFDLPRQKSRLILGLLGFFLVLASLPGQAQSGMRYRRTHLQTYDDRPIHYGFLFGAPFTRYNVRLGQDYVRQGTAYQIFSPRKGGFMVGGVLNMYLNEDFDLRFTPSVQIIGRTVEYRFPSNTQASDTRESAWWSMPLMLKYKSVRRHNSRMYLVGGMALNFETGIRRREVQGTNRLLTRTTDLTAEYGIGFEQFFEFFKFTPELRFSHGLVNLYDAAQPNPASVGIRKLNSHTVTLILAFE